MNYLNPAYMFTIEQDYDADIEELIYLSMASKNLIKKARQSETAKQISKQSDTILKKLPDSDDSTLYNEMKVQVRDKTTGRYASIPGNNKVKSIDARIADKSDRLERGTLNKNVSDSDYNKIYNEFIDSCKLEISVIDKEIDRLASKNGGSGPAKEFLAKSYRGQVKRFNEVITEDMVKIGRQFKELREEYMTYAKELGRQTSLLVYKMLERMLDKMERKSRMM